MASLLKVIPSNVEQRDLISALHREHGIFRNKDEKVYLLESSWYYDWEDYTKQPLCKENVDQGIPGPINNDNLLNEGGELKSDLVQSFDYIVVSEPVWVALKQWYGGGPEICRYTILNADGHIEVEVYPYKLLVSIVDIAFSEWSFTYEQEILISKTKTVAELYEKLISMFRQVYAQEMNLEVRGYRLQVATMGDNFRVVNLEKNGFVQTTLENTRWKQGDSQVVKIMLEAKSNDGVWLSERLTQKKSPKIEYPPNGGYSGGRVELLTSGMSIGTIGNFPRYPTRRYEDITVNRGDNIKSDIQGVCGLENIGNTCYLNSSLQALAHCEPLARYIVTNAFLSDVTTKRLNPLIFHFASVLQLLRSGEHSVVTPGEFKHQLGVINRFFKGYRQHDAEEFVSFLLDRLSDETNKAKDPRVNDEKESEDCQSENSSKEAKIQNAAYLAQKERRKMYNSHILDLFEGQFASQLQCKVCESMSTSFEPFLVLSVAIPTEAKKEEDIITLEDCLQEFSTEEALSGSNKWYCSKCNELRPATKKLSLLADFIPQILIIQLKRFTSLGVKVNEAVKFGKELDLSKFVVPSTSTQRKSLRYKLFSTTQHMGVCGGGHYTSHTVCEDGKWRVFNDQNVFQAELDEINPNAYILYFERINS